jgi:hypothetical protein
MHAKNILRSIGARSAVAAAALARLLNQFPPGGGG